MEKDRPAPGAAPLGLAAFLASLAVLFAASIAAYAAVRWNAPDWGSTPLPRLLWVSSGFLLISSGTLHWALVSARRGEGEAVRLGLAATTLLGLAFVACQLLCWETLLAREVRPDSGLFGFTFYLLTGLHGVHVVGGLVPLAVTTARALRWDCYGPSDHQGVLMCAMYWHFLGVVWFLLLGTLVLGS